MASRDEPLYAAPYVTEEGIKEASRSDAIANQMKNMLRMMGKGK